MHAPVPAFAPAPAPAPQHAPTFAEQAARAAQAFNTPFSLEPAVRQPTESAPLAAVLSPGEAIASGQAPLPSNLEDWLNEQERLVLVRALDETGFNRTAAAAMLGLNLRQMRYRMARLGIVPPGSQGSHADDDGDDSES